LADPVFRLQVIAALPEDVEGHAAMVFWCSRATTRAIGVRATAIETVHAFVADLLAQPGLARMLGQRQSTFCFFDLIAGGQVAVATPGPGTAAPAGQFFATWLAAAAYSAVTAYQVLALNQKIAFWLVVDLAFDLPISQWLDPSLAGGRDPGIHWVYTDDPLGMLSRSLKKTGSLSAAGGSPPPPVSPLSEAELARLDEAETRPNRQAQTTFIRTHYALGKPHGWADFQALRRRRDTQLYQALWQQPTLIEDPIERIYILSALKYGTPGYEIDLETTLTPAELAR
jgi:hypothetical protein